MIDLWYRGRMYKHLLASLSGLLIALLVQGCCEDPEVDFCSLENMPSSELWGLCQVDEQCPEGTSCRGATCGPNCESDADCQGGFCSDEGTCRLPCADYPLTIYAYASCEEDFAGEKGGFLGVDLCQQCGPSYCPWYEGWEG